MHLTAAELTRYAITGAIIAFVLFLRLRNVGKARRLRLETLWIIPTLFIAFAIFIFSSFRLSVWAGCGSRSRRCWAAPSAGSVRG